MLGTAAAIGLLAAGMFIPRVAPQAPVADPATVPPDLSAAQDASSPTPFPANSAPVSLAVYVCGAVRKAGVYTLNAGARVVDAIALAGGASSSADLEQLNLAEALSDGMKIDVPVKGQIIAQDAGSDSLTAAAAYANAGGQRASRTGRHHSSRGGAHKLQAGQTLNVNTAGETELTQLPGVGPSLARRIIEYRQANGPFQTADDLQNVAGIGPSKFAKMEPYIRV